MLFNETTLWTLHGNDFWIEVSHDLFSDGSHHWQIKVGIWYDHDLFWEEKETVCKLIAMHDEAYYLYYWHNPNVFGEDSSIYAFYYNHLDDQETFCTYSTKEEAQEVFEDAERLFHILTDYKE